MRMHFEDVDSASEPISVCIAAHNEGRTIARTIESIINQQFHLRPEMEVLVCANACDDNTAGEVKRMQERYPGIIRLIEVAEKGKPNAWNILRKEARYNYLFFVDGDVEVDEKAFSFMHRLLQHRDNLIAVAATNAAVLKNCSFLTRLSRPYTKDDIFIKDSQNVICGRLYAFKKAELEAVMQEFNYEEMPDDIIHEDAWLQRVLDVAASVREGISLERVIRGEKRYWIACREALVYFVPQSWREDPQIKARALHAHEQLRGFFPEYYEILERIREASSSSAAQKSTGKLNELISMGWSASIRHAIRRLMQRRANRKARRIFERNEADSEKVSAQNWIRSELSRVRRRQSLVRR